MKSTLSLLLVSLALTVFCQDKPTASIPRLNGEIDFDGIVDEAFWKDIEVLPMTSHIPDFNLPAYKNTEIRIVYDDDFLYLSAICYEDPKNIQESSFRRDANWELQSDQIALILDTYNDAENGVMFVVSPSGARTDQTIRNDGISGGFYNNSWNTFWEAKTNVFEKGWQMEMKIPFNILRFDTKDQLTKMGLSAYRYSAFDKKMDTYPAISNQFGFFSFGKPSLTQDVSFENIKNKRPLYFTPFILGSKGESSTLNATEDAYISTQTQDLSAGFSAQYAITNNLNADISFNTDFAQVEADNQQVNLTRFSLFFPEKRRFFQERSSTFEFNNDGNNKLFYSRRIGLNEGQIIPLWGGVRLVGRAGKSDFGAISMQSKSFDNFDSENYGVARMRTDIINDNSYLGAMVTTVTSANGAYNVGYGTDALINLFGDEYLKVNFAQTISDLDSSGSIMDKSRIFLEWEKRKNVGFGYRLNFSHVGDKYNPALGFENRYDYWRLGDRLFYNLWMKETSKLQKIDISLNSNVFVNRSTDQIETGVINPSVSIVGKNEFSIDAGISSFFDHPLDTFSLSSVVYVTPQNYWNHTASISYSSPQIKRFRSTIGYQYGGFYGGTISSPSLSMNYLPNKYLQFDLSAEYNNIQIPEFETFESLVGRFILTVSFDVKWTVSSFAQYNSRTDLWAINSRLRFNPKDGINLYLVYNGNFNVNTESLVPRPPSTASSLFVVKYSHTLFL